jgi:hypothetical protein
MTFAFLISHFNGAGFVYYGAKNRLFSNLKPDLVALQTQKQ